MKHKGKIKTSRFNREWSGPNGTIFYHYIEVEGYEKRINIGAKSQDPDFLSVGKEIDLEITEDDKGVKGKVVRENFGGGFGGKKFTPKSMTLQEVMEYCRANALRAQAICDDKFERKQMGGFRDLCLFIAGEVKTDIELWGDARRDMDNRRDSLLSAAERTRAEGYTDHDALILKAREHFGIIKGIIKP